MPINRNALIRYKTIDNCLKNRFRQWTLEDLIESCSDALYEYEGIQKGVSRRTIQSDIQFMRSDKLGYNAPIIVKDRKYYAYEDPDYSITNIPLTGQDLEKLSEVVHILRQFKGFSHFLEVTEIIHKLEDKIHTEKGNEFPIIDFEKNENLKGLELLDIIYKAIQKKKAIELVYKSFTAKKENTFVFHAYLLKEYRNRWFILGKKDEEKDLITLALDRIIEIKVMEYANYNEYNIGDPSAFYRDIIGITINKNQKTEEVKLFVNNKTAPYILTKPLHHSQKIIGTLEDGIEISIHVILNFELERELLSYGEGIKVLWPPKLIKHIKERINKASDYYK